MRGEAGRGRRRGGGRREAGREGRGGRGGGGRRGDFFADLGEVGGGREAGIADGLEALDLVAEGAGEFAVDVERAAAHAGDGAHFLDAFVGEFADDERFAGAEGVADDPGDFDAERLGLGAAENRPDLAALAGLELVEGDRRAAGGLRGGGADEERGERDRRGEQASDGEKRHEGNPGDYASSAG